MKQNNPQVLEKKYCDAKKLNTVLLEEIATFKLKSDSVIKELQEKNLELLSLKNKGQNNGNFIENSMKQLEILLNETRQKNFLLMNENEELKQKNCLNREKDSELSTLKKKYEGISQEFERLTKTNIDLDLKNKELEHFLIESNQKNEILMRELEEIKLKNNSFPLKSVYFPREDELIKNLKRENDQLNEQIELSRRFSTTTYQFNDKSTKNNNYDDHKKINDMLEIELKRLKIELDNKSDKMLKYEENIHNLEIKINEEKHKRDLDILEVKNYKNQLETLKAENQFFQNENSDLLEDRKKKMDKIITLESENRSVKSNNLGYLNKIEQSSEFKELKSKNQEFLKELNILKTENNKMKIELDRFKRNYEDYDKILKENQILSDLNEEYKLQIDEQQFQVNAMTNELNVQKTNHFIKKSQNESNYIDYEQLFQEKKQLKNELENYKLKYSEQISRINSLTDELNFHKTDGLKNSQKLNLDAISSLDLNTQEIIENLQNEKKALLNKTESIQRELIKLQKDRGGSLEINGDREKNDLRRRVMELEMEIQMLLKEKGNFYNQSKGNKNNSRSIFG